MKLGWRRDRRPVPPQNVRVVLRDGREVPVECVYAGVVAGLHHWEAAWPVAGEVVCLKADVVPGHTSVGVRSTPDAG